LPINRRDLLKSFQPHAVEFNRFNRTSTAPFFLKNLLESAFGTQEIRIAL
jgi:hypothetical protein